VSEAEAWTPIRFVRSLHQCESCKATILLGSPGSSTGTRGTRAFWTKQRDAWRCLSCHTEITRSDRAREACVGCRTLVPRYLEGDAWVHHHRGEEPMSCTFLEEQTTSALSLERVA
jgi:hypothetical protein